MVEVGGRPMLWHIMKIYASHGITDFVVCLGYRGYVIKEYFANYFLHTSDVTFDMARNRMEIHRHQAEPWTVTLVETGDLTNTGGRLLRVAPYLADDEDFCLTYGDGVTDADLTAEIAFHQSGSALVTVLAVRPPGRYGALSLQGDVVTEFEEKPVGDGGRISGGFFVVARSSLDAIEGDATSWEGDTLKRLALLGQVNAFVHDGFWQPMDTLRERNELEAHWSSGSAPWKVW